MKILIHSRSFLPNLGGMEVMMHTLADQFVRGGHSVAVVTKTPAAGGCGAQTDYEVVRGMSVLRTFWMARRSDVCLSANISLRSLGPLLAAGTPVFVHHGGWYGAGRLGGIVDSAKLAASKYVRNIYCSHSVADHISARGVVIPNSFRTGVFRLFPEVKRDGDIVCFGRLVSDKGFDLAIKALDRLNRNGHARRLTIVGSGPEEQNLRRLVAQRALGTAVTFVGPLYDEALARVIASHRVAVVPSVWEEPFGIVALEALACGCRVIVSDGGGLPEAVGDCGVLFRRGDYESLANALEHCAGVDFEDEYYRSRLRLHLEAHSAETIAARYLAAFAQSMPTGSLNHAGTL